MSMSSGCVLAASICRRLRSAERNDTTKVVCERLDVDRRNIRAPKECAADDARQAVHPPISDASFFCAKHHLLLLLYRSKHLCVPNRLCVPKICTAIVTASMDYRYDSLIFDRRRHDTLFTGRNKTFLFFFLNRDARFGVDAGKKFSRNRPTSTLDVYSDIRKKKNGLGRIGTPAHDGASFHVPSVVFTTANVWVTV
jgi:hypothetical protein